MQIAHSSGRPVLAALRPLTVASRPGGSLRLASLVPRLPGFPLLWAAAVLIPVLAVLGAGVLAWHDVRRDAEARVERTLGLLLQHALHAFATQDAILAATTRAIDGRGWDELRGNADLQSLLADLAAAGEPVVRGVMLTDDAGRVVATSRDVPAHPAELAARDDLRAVREGARLAVSEVQAGDRQGRPSFALARPVAARPGPARPPGVLVTSLSPDSMAEFYASASEAPRDVVALLRLDGAVLARHPPLPEGNEAELRPLRAAHLAAALAQPPGLPARAKRSGADQVERLFVARRVGAWPVAVTYGLSLDGLRSAWWERMLAPTIGGIAAATLLLALTALAAQGAREQAAAAERRTEAEAQLARAGRAAAIGLLAAGLAHDVKNLVQAVRSGARLMARHAEDPEEVRRCAALLDDAAERGRRLVEAMLAFARGGGGETAMPSAPLEVGSVLSDLVELLNRTLGSGWRVQAALQPGLPLAQGDRAAFEAAVVNLAANARDAMPLGGTVTIAAWPEQLDEAAEQDGLKPGRYVVAAVSDTGAGMDAETLARVGEPFFTTKGPGRGTGLGLATVRGFCVRTGGALRIDSEPGRGTTAAMWLPVV